MLFNFHILLQLPYYSLINVTKNTCTKLDYCVFQYIYYLIFREKFMENKVFYLKLSIIT